MKRETIGVVGHGFVGEAVARGFCHAFDVLVYDKDPEKGLFWVVEGMEPRMNSIEGLEDYGLSPPGLLVEKCSVIFVCVPTPMLPDGSCDTSVVEGVVGDLDRAAYDNDREVVSEKPLHVKCTRKQRTVVIKSTVPPGTTARLQEEFGWLDLVFNPEFLTEANHIDDFKNQDRIILGGEDEAVQGAIAVYASTFPCASVFRTTSHVAEMMKYATNAFLAVKVSFANEVEGLCRKMGIDYGEVARLLRFDKRLGDTHWQVPGPDGKRGFGGSCFPKDLRAMIHMTENEETVSAAVLEGAWETNLVVRPERDWEELIGRAVAEGYNGEED